VSYFKNGKVREIKTVGDLLGSVAIGPIRGSVCFREGEIPIVISGVRVKNIKGGYLENPEMIGIQVLDFIKKVGPIRSARETQRFLRNRGAISFVNGIIVVTQNMKIQRL